MYACICNAIPDKVIDEAIDDGARSMKGVFKFRETRPKCGRCVEWITEEVNKRLAARGLEPSADQVALTAKLAAKAERERAKLAAPETAETDTADAQARDPAVTETPTKRSAPRMQRSAP